MDAIKKFSHVEKQAVAEDDLALVNQQALKPLAAEEIFVFRFVACDNQIDRACEKFSDAALGQLAKLYVGKTVISDHMWSAGKQTARIYAAEVVSTGELKQLVLRAYMLRNEQTDATISAIEGGIMREVSVGCSVSEATCSICGINRRDSFCGHWPGNEYEGKTCHITLDGATDAYEASFVAVPAQPGAGVIKRYGGAGEPQEGEPLKAEPDEQELLAMAWQEQEEKRYGGIFS